MDFEQFLDAVSQSHLDEEAVASLRQEMLCTEELHDTLDRKRAVTTEVLSRTCSL